MPSFTKLSRFENILAALALKGQVSYCNTKKDSEEEERFHAACKKYRRQSLIRQHQALLSAARLVL